MSNYYEVLGVWRDASPSDIEMAAQTLSEHWQAALALHDPIAPDWLQIIEQARQTLLDPETRIAYDQKLVEPHERPVEIFSPGFPWKPYLAALLTVPILLSTFVLVLGAIANADLLTNATELGDSLLVTMIVVSAICFPAALVVLMLSAGVRDAARRLRILERKEVVDPSAMAQVVGEARLSEYADVAVWVTWGSITVVVAMWLWFLALLIGVGI